MVILARKTTKAESTNTRLLTTDFTLQIRDTHAKRERPEGGVFHRVFTGFCWGGTFENAVKICWTTARTNRFRPFGFGPFSRVGRCNISVLVPWKTIFVEQSEKQQPLVLGGCWNKVRSPFLSNPPQDLSSREMGVKIILNSPLDSPSTPMAVRFSGFLCNTIRI